MVGFDRRPRVRQLGQAREIVFVIKLDRFLDRAGPLLQRRYLLTAFDLAEIFFDPLSGLNESKSPATTSVTLFGTYQRRKNSFTSSSRAFCRSSSEPITCQLYGWSSG